MSRALLARAYAALARLICDDTLPQGQPAILYPTPRELTRRAREHPGEHYVGDGSWVCREEPGGTLIVRTACRFGHQPPKPPAKAGPEDPWPPAVYRGDAWWDRYRPAAPHELREAGYVLWYQPTGRTATRPYVLVSGIDEDDPAVIGLHGARRHSWAGLSTRKRQTGRPPGRPRKAHVTVVAPAAQE